MARQIPSFAPLLALLLLRSSSTTAQYDLLWSDEFDTLDQNVWSYDLGADGWGNGELQEYTSSTDNVKVNNGLLEITALQTGSGSSATFTSGRIKSEAAVTFRYGVVEARIRVPQMDAGLWPAFWTLGEDFYQVGWPQSGEVDIMEMGQGLAIAEGKVNNRVVSAAHWDIFGEYATYAKYLDSDVDLTQGFHNFKLEWTPQRMTTYVDGNWIWEMDIDPSTCPSCDELHQPQFMLLSLAVGGGFTSGSASSSSGSSSCASSSMANQASSGTYCPARKPEDISVAFPQTMYVDWVRIYDNGYANVTFPQPPVREPQQTTGAPVEQVIPGATEPRQTGGGSSGGIGSKIVGTGSILGTGSRFGGSGSKSKSKSGFGSRQGGSRQGGSKSRKFGSRSYSGVRQTFAGSKGKGGGGSPFSNAIAGQDTEFLPDKGVQNGASGVTASDKETASQGVSGPGYNQQEGVGAASLGESGPGMSQEGVGVSGSGMSQESAGASGASYTEGNQNYGANSVVDGGESSSSDAAPLNYGSFATNGGATGDEASGQSVSASAAGNDATTNKDDSAYNNGEYSPPGTQQDGRYTHDEPTSSTTSMEQVPPSSLVAANENRVANANRASSARSSYDRNFAFVATAVVTLGMLLIGQL